MTGSGLRAQDLEVLDLLLNAAEPTWIMLEELSAPLDDRPALEAILRELERNGLVTRSRELSGNPNGRPMEPDDWWALTAAGWVAQGLDEPPGYNARQGAPRSK